MLSATSPHLLLKLPANVLAAFGQFACIITGVCEHAIAKQGCSMSCWLQRWPSDCECGPSGCKVGPSGCKCGPSGCNPGPSDSLCALQAELRQLQPVLEKTAVDVDAMMVRITADKKEAAATQKAVAQQEQEANEQAARVSGKLLLSVQRTLFMPDLHMRYLSAVLCTELVSSE